MSEAHLISTPEGPTAIADAIRVSRSLSGSDLRHNYLGKEGWCAVFDALRDSPQNTIAKWDLSREWVDSRIDMEIVKSLAAYIAVSRSLSSIE